MLNTAAPLKSQTCGGKAVLINFPNTYAKLNLIVHNYNMYRNIAILHPRDLFLIYYNGKMR